MFLVFNRRGVCELKSNIVMNVQQLQMLQQMTEMSEDAKAYESAQYGPEDAHRTFVALSVPKKLVVMLGGPTMNLLISVLLMVVLVGGIGLPSVTPTVRLRWSTS